MLARRSSGLVWYVVLILMKHHEVGLVGLNDPIKTPVVFVLFSMLQSFEF